MQLQHSHLLWQRRSYMQQLHQNLRRIQAIRHPIAMVQHRRQHLLQTLLISNDACLGQAQPQRRLHN